jgi:hypothetical protein
MTKRSDNYVDNYRDQFAGQRGVDMAAKEGLYFLYSSRLIIGSDKL